MRHVLILSLLVGCQMPEDAERLVRLQTLMSQSREDATEIKQTLSEHTDALREIRDAVKTAKAAGSGQPAVQPDDADQTPETAPGDTTSDPSSAAAVSGCNNPDCDCEDCDGQNCNCGEQKEQRYAWSTKHFRLVKYGADWCGPCKQWDRTEQRKISCDVQHWDTDKRPLGWIGSIPTFRLFQWDGRGWSTARTWSGWTSADTINGEISRQIQTLTGKARATQGSTAVRRQQPSGNPPVTRSASPTLAELRQWVRARYTPATCCREADVAPRSAVWQHLTQDHGFASSQVRGLSQWEALALHSAAHSGQITAGG